MRQKTELEITLQAAATGEARSGGMEGTEARPARTETEARRPVGRRWKRLSSETI